MRKHLRDILSERIPQEVLSHVYNSYDIIGDIAIIRLTEASRKYRRIIAEAIMSIHKNVKTVLAQISPVQGDFRLRRLEFVAGENRTLTVHKESGCLFSVNVAKCYFSPRLFYERMRVARQVRAGETIVNMFAGVGCFSIIIAKHSAVKKVYSVDVNPAAFQFMRENVRLNRVCERVIPILGDAKNVVQEKLRHVADRVLMPLPEKAFEYLPHALFALKDKGERWIHYYDFEHAKKCNPLEKVRLRVAEKLESLDVACEVPFSRIVRTTGPNWYQVVLDIKIEG